jgi:hypothetical protein
MDMMALQSQPSAEFLRPCRQGMLLDADQRRRVGRHDRHARVHDRAAVAFGGDARGAATQQTRHEAFDHRPAVATSARDVHLVRRTLSVQTRLVQDAAHVLLTWHWRERRDGAWDTHRADAAGVERLAPRRLMERQIAGQRMDGQRAPSRDSRKGLLDAVEQGPHRAEIIRVAHGQLQGNAEAGGHLSEHARFAAKRRRTVPLACADGGQSAIIGMDDCAMRQRRAMGQTSRWFGKPLLRGQGHLQRGGHALSWSRRKRLRLIPGCPCGVPQRQELSAGLKPMLCRLAPQLHQHVALPATLAAEAAPHPLEVVLEAAPLGLQACCPRSQRVGPLRHDVEDFLGA